MAKRKATTPQTITYELVWDTSRTPITCKGLLLHAFVEGAGKARTVKIERLRILALDHWTVDYFERTAEPGQRELKHGSRDMRQLERLGFRLVRTETRHGYLVHLPGVGTVSTNERGRFKGLTEPLFAGWFKDAPYTTSQERTEAELTKRLT